MAVTAAVCFCNRWCNSLTILHRCNVWHKTPKIIKYHRHLLRTNRFIKQNYCVLRRQQIHVSTSTVWQGIGSRKTVSQQLSKINYETNVCSNLLICIKHGIVCKANHIMFLTIKILTSFCTFHKRLSKLALRHTCNDPSTPQKNCPSSSCCHRITWITPDVSPAAIAVQSKCPSLYIRR